MNKQTEMIFSCTLGIWACAGGIPFALLMASGAPYQSSFTTAILCITIPTTAIVLPLLAFCLTPVTIVLDIVSFPFRVMMGCVF